MALISWIDLAWCLLPVVLVGIIYQRWIGSSKEMLIAAARMVVQLIVVGYALVSIFNNPSPWLSLLIVSVMLVVAGWIAIRPVKQQTDILLPALVALSAAVSVHLAISIVLVLGKAQWYTPVVLIPLAGMYLANTMNGISLSAERYFAELDAGKPFEQARLTAFHAAMIPQINGLLAVGLVALPGMMTGQILSGVSPLVAVRYQIMIMTMILGTTGMGCALMLWLLERKQQTVQ